jgi:flagellar biosynthesis/type III secretory pathway chaperone
MTVGSSSTHDLSSSLARQLEALRALRRALEAETEALRSSSPAALEAATTEKTRCLEAVEAAAGELLTAARARGFEAADTRLEEWLATAAEAPPGLADGLRAVRAEAGQCQAINRRNGAVIEGTRQELADALSALHGRTAPVAGTYDERGARGGPTGHRIGEA